MVISTENEHPECAIFRYNKEVFKNVCTEQLMYIIVIN